MRSSKDTEAKGLVTDTPPLWDIEVTAPVEPARTFERVPAAARNTRPLVRAALFLSDALVLLLATSIASAFAFGTATGTIEMGGAYESVPLLSLQLTSMWLLALAFSGAYMSDRSWGSADIAHAVRSVAMGTAGFILLRYLLHMSMPSRIWLISSWALATVLIALEHLGVRAGFSWLHRKGRMVRRTLVVGTNSEAASVVQTLLKGSSAGFVPVGCLSSSLKDRLSLDYTAPVVPTLGDARNLRTVIAELRVDVVVVVTSAFDHEVLERLISELSDAGVEVYLSSSLSDVLRSRVSVREVVGMPFISLRGISLSPANLLVKRVFDLAIAIPIIVLGLPVWLTVAALIKLTSKGPVFYVQQRIGLKGEPFGMYKFRSMVVGADAQLDELRRSKGIKPGPIFKLADDPRISPVGHWMRKFSIDEFPQLLNVVKGDMSLVGPRPPLPNEVVYYKPLHWRRLEVVPGMTGLWQVSGRSGLSFDDMVRLDLYYMGNWSVSLDLSILARTIPAVVLARGAV